MRDFFRGWKRTTGLFTLVIACVFAVGCTRYYTISVYGLVTTEDEKPLSDVMISINADGPGPTEKWTGPDGTFTRLDLKFDITEFEHGKLQSKSLWFAKEGYVPKKVDVQCSKKPNGIPEVREIPLNVRLDRA